MKYLYLDASFGLSGDMILAALMDLGADVALFKEKMATLNLPVKIEVNETKRASLRALKVNVVIQKNNHIPRKWQDVKRLIEKSVFSRNVKKRSLAIFKNLFKAEALVHGYSFHEAHLHEAGADDAVIDIVGTCYLIDLLDIKEILSSPLNVGKGFVKTSHGVLPVPAPAVAELLKNTPIYSALADEELVTPTGAAIVSSLAQKFISFPEMCYEKMGCGAGSRNFSNFPNVLRVFYGNRSEVTPDKKIFQIETNIDDSNPQILAGFIDKALEMGAIDAFLTPVVMKKNRLGSKLTVLAGLDKIDVVVDSIFKETTSIGVRYFPVERRTLRREFLKARVLGEDIRIKVSILGDERVSVQPEYTDCKRIAKKKHVPVKKVMELALTWISASKAAEEKKGSKTSS